jgi:hypothetical protein
MAHVVTKLPRITAFDPAATKIFPEPYHSKEEMKFELPELGESWERFMFDVCIDPAPQSVTGALSTKIQDYGVAGQTPFRYLAQQMKRTHDKMVKSSTRNVQLLDTSSPAKNRKLVSEELLA